MYLTVVFWAPGTGRPLNFCLEATVATKNRTRDLRKAERLTGSFEVTFSDGKHFYTEFLQDISTGGAQIESRRALEPGTEITLALSSEPPVKLKGIVRWVRRVGLKYRMGVQFRKVDPKQEAAIR